MSVPADALWRGAPCGHARFEGIPARCRPESRKAPTVELSAQSLGVLRHSFEVHHENQSRRRMAGRPALTIETVDLEGPRLGEVLVEIKATGICHTDYYTLSGADPEGIFPAILGHEGAGIVVDVGPGVTSLKKGDHVISALHARVPPVQVLPLAQDQPVPADPRYPGRGLMPDATSRFSLDGKPIFHYMGTSTFSNYTVAPEISLAKIREDAPFDKVCYIGCGVTTGIGAVIFTAKGRGGRQCGGVWSGRYWAERDPGCQDGGRRQDHWRGHQPARQAMARKFGMTHFINPRKWTTWSMPSCS